MRRALAACAFLLAAHSTAAAQSAIATDTATVEQRVLVAGETTPADARRRAIEGALAEAVRRVLGVRLQSAQIGIASDDGGRASDGFVSVVQLDAAGRAVDYRILHERWVPGAGGELRYEVRLVATVARDVGAPDPAFRVDAELNDALFFVEGADPSANAEVVVTARATRDAWLTVLAIADDSVQVLFPNALVGELRAAADAAVEVPDAGWRAQGIRLRATLPTGRSSRREVVAVVATRDAVPPPARGRTTNDAGAADPSISLLELQRWLVSIPADRRAVSFAAYEVRRR